MTSHVTKTSKAKKQEQTLSIIMSVSLVLTRSVNDYTTEEDFFMIYNFFIIIKSLSC